MSGQRSRGRRAPAGAAHVPAASPARRPADSAASRGGVARPPRRAQPSGGTARSPSLTVSPTRAPASPADSHLRIPPPRGEGRRIPRRLFCEAPARPLTRLAVGPGSRGRRGADWRGGEVFPGSDGAAASAPLFTPSPRSSRFLFHPRDRERRRRHDYYGAGRRSPESARPVRLREPRRRRPRPPGPGAPARARPPARPAPGSQVSRARKCAARELRSRSPEAWELCR